MNLDIKGYKPKSDCSVYESRIPSFHNKFREGWITLKDLILPTTYFESIKPTHLVIGAPKTDKQVRYATPVIGWSKCHTYEDRRSSLQSELDGLPNRRWYRKRQIIQTLKDIEGKTGAIMFTMKDIKFEEGNQ